MATQIAMLTFDEIKPAMHKWAHHFQNREFEHWELINAVWAMGAVQKLSHINFASGRIKYDMIDYMRTASGSRTPNKHKTLSGAVSINSKINEDQEFGDTMACIASPAEIDDLFALVLKGLNRREKLIIKLKYCEGFTQDDIAEVVGCTGSMISLSLTSLHKRIRIKLKNTIYESRTCQRTSRFKPVKTNSPEYSRMYYQANKERISKRRAG